MAAERRAVPLLSIGCELLGSGPVRARRHDIAHPEDHAGPDGIVPLERAEVDAHIDRRGREGAGHGPLVLDYTAREDRLEPLPALLAREQVHENAAATAADS